MNANLQGLWNYYFSHPRCPECDGIIVSDKGEHLSHDEAKRYVRYCLDKGFKDLHSCPDFETFRNEAKKRRA